MPAYYWNINCADYFIWIYCKENFHGQPIVITRTSQFTLSLLRFNRKPQSQSAHLASLNLRLERAFHCLLWPLGIETFLYKFYELQVLVGHKLSHYGFISVNKIFLLSATLKKNGRDNVTTISLSLAFKRQFLIFLSSLHTFTQT